MRVRAPPDARPVHPRYPHRRMSARTRVLAIVALAATAAVVATVGGTLLQTRGESTTAPGAVSKPRAGAPLLQLDFGVRADAQARALANAAKLYNAGKLAAAGRIFARYHSLDAQIGSAFAAWPKGGLDTMKRLVAANPHSALARAAPRLGVLLVGPQRRRGRRVDAHRRAPAGLALCRRRRERAPPVDGAGAAVHRLDRLAAGEPDEAARGGGAAALARAAERPDADAKLFYGVALWNLRHPVSAERQLNAAAKLAPDDPMIRTAAAVGAFRKAEPVAAFGKLGPLTGVFPKAAVVRFHLGILLLWTSQPKKAEHQLQLAARPVPEVRVRERGTDTDRESGERWDQVKENMSRTAYGVTSGAHGTVRHLRFVERDTSGPGDGRPGGGGT